MRKKRVVLVGASFFMMLLFFVGLKEKENNHVISPEDGIRIEEYGVKGNGVTDDTEKFQYALEDATKKGKTLIIPAKTFLVSPLQYRDSTSLDWWCLSIPSNANLYFEDGALLKLVDNAPEKTRIFVISEVSNINIYGYVAIDGSAHTVQNGNEHMHGIFIYDAKDVFIESAYSFNSYGDNLFIGGTEDDYSENVRIHSFRGETAGRKNLVIHYVDNLYIGTAILDNSKGNVLNNWNGGNSLDLEPDDYQGRKKFFQRIDYISTYGMGNDFTVGTKGAMAKKWVLEIGDLRVILMEGAREGLRSYAATVKIERLILKSQPKNNDIGVRLLYAAYWEIDEAYFIDGRDYAISAKAADDESPKLILGRVFVSRPNGRGIELWGADATINTIEVNRVKNTVLDVLSTTPQQIKITNLISINSGEKEIIKVADYGYVPHIRIVNFLVRDVREHPVESIFYLKTQKAVDNFKVENLQKDFLLDEVTYGPNVQRTLSIFENKENY